MTRADGRILAVRRTLLDGRLEPTSLERADDARGVWDPDAEAWVSNGTLVRLGRNGHPIFVELVWVKAAALDATDAEAVA